MLYTTPALGQATGGMLRPGGLALTAILLEQCDFAPGGELLDVGCGPGHSLAFLSETFQVTGLDAAQTMLGKARCTAPRARLVQGQATDLPFQNASFDAVLAECVLSLCSEPERMLGEVHRVLRPGAWLMLSDLYLKNGKFESDLPIQAGCLLHAAPIAKTLAQLDRCGFSVLNWADQSHALKQLAGQLIFDQGSLESFWSTILDVEGAQSLCRAVQKSPPGYYTLVARKQ